MSVEKRYEGALLLSQQWVSVMAWHLRIDPASTKDGSLRKDLHLRSGTCFMKTLKGKHSNKRIFNVKRITLCYGFNRSTIRHFLFNPTPCFFGEMSTQIFWPI